MGSKLSVVETAYKQLDRELKSQNGDYMDAIKRFIGGCESLKVRFISPE